MDSFSMIHRFQFLHCCYFVWEELQFFSDCVMRCCKPDIFLLCQPAQMILLDSQHRVINVQQLLISKFRWSPTSLGPLTLSLFHEICQ
jgi:hypothetical protein